MGAEVALTAEAVAAVDVTVPVLVAVAAEAVAVAVADIYAAARPLGGRTALKYFMFNYFHWCQHI